jgi:hypothetical protein
MTGAKTAVVARQLWNTLTPEQRHEITDGAVSLAKQSGRVVGALKKQRRSGGQANVSADARQLMEELRQDLRRIAGDVKDAGRPQSRQQDQDGAAGIQEATNGSRPANREGVNNA